MELKDYFENTEGSGILATADSDGKVDTAIYARPHFLEDGTMAWIMRDRLTHLNLQSNPHVHRERARLQRKTLFFNKSSGRTGFRAATFRAAAPIHT